MKRWEEAMTTRDYVLDKDMEAVWRTGDEYGRMRIRGLAKLATCAARRNVGPVQVRIIAADGKDVLDTVMP